MTPEQSEKIFDKLEKGIEKNKITVVDNVLDSYIENHIKVQEKEIRIFIPLKYMDYFKLKEFIQDKESNIIMWDWIRLKYDFCYHGTEERFQGVLIGEKNFIIAIRYVLEYSVYDLDYMFV